METVEMHRHEEEADRRQQSFLDSENLFSRHNFTPMLEFTYDFISPVIEI